MALSLQRSVLVVVLVWTSLPLCAVADVRIDTPIPLLLLDGDGATRGNQAAQHIGPRVAALVPLVATMPHFRVDDATFDRLVPQLDPDHRAELEAIASGAGLDPRRVIAANIAIDSLCTVLVRPPTDQRPLAMMRSMDFHPAMLIGGTTMLTTWRKPGALTVTSVGWPGYAGVVSGINEAGLSAAVLMNRGRGAPRTGAPVTFRIREVLEQSRTVDEAVAAFAGAVSASDHFVVFADASQAAVVFQHGPEGETLRRDMRADGWLTCANGRADARGVQRDDRTRILERLLRRSHTHPVTDAALRQTLWRVHQSSINAQSMLLIPDTQVVDLAVAGLGRAATENVWHRYELAPLLAGGDLSSVRVRSLGRQAP